MEITVTWINRVDHGYGDFMNTEQVIDIEWTGSMNPIDHEAVAAEVERRVDNHFNDFRGITEIRQGEQVIWEE